MTEPANSKILIICSSEDREWKDRILGLLTGRGMGDRLEVWENGNRAGTTGGWLGEYNQAIEHAGVVVPLISPQFVAYQKSVERPEIHLSLQARGSSGSPIYPILLRPSDWEGLGWLQHNTIYPENGLALSNVDADEIDARLVLIGLEIGARAFVPGLLNSMSAKLLLPAGTFGGMVTLINPAVAVSVPQGDPTDDRPRTLVVETGIMVQTIQAAVVGRDPSLDCCLFRLIPPSQATLPPTRFDLPSPGSTWECLTFTSDDSPVEFATGTVVGATTRNGREYLHLRPIPEAQTPQGMSGAPIVVDGHLVGVLASEGAILNEWFALPVKSIAASPLGAAIWPPETRTAGTEATQPPSQTAAGTQHPPDFDQADFLARLGSAARDSLARAEGLRTALGQDRLHIDHLILGLYGRPDSPMRRLAREAGIQGLKGLLDLLSPWNAQLSSSADRVDLTPGILPIPFDSLPTLSAHVQRAIAFAWNHVRSSGVRTLGRRHLTDGIFSLDDCPVVQAFRERLPKAVSPTIRVVPEQDWLPGVVSDWPGEKDPDLLNLKRDVHAICSVIAAQDAALPLSIGLFGDWGSGKSFFMKEMEQKIRELEKKGPPSYCSNIVQLKFNAWHYIDTNLWASLTSEIFEGLVTALSRQPGAEPENEAARILAEVSTSRDKLADAERKKDEADCELAKAESALSHLRDAEADIRAKLSSRLIFKQAVDLALQQDEVKQKLADAAKELNLPEAGAAGTELKNELLEVRGLGGAIALAMRNTEKLRTWVLAFVLLAGSLFIIYRWALPWALGHGLPDLVGHLVAIVAGITALISPFLNKARRALGLLQEARTRSEKIIKDEQDKQRDQLQKDRYQKAKAVEQQEKAVDQARSKVDQLEQKLRDLRVDRQMFDFIKRRNESTDYTRHLGVIARAHKDFRELSTLLQQVKSAPAMDLPRVERIVLYIDDLDRCPENKVMDVLQAVHLLLAFPLFVVVVGVDPRWLLHSVSEHSPAFRRRSTEAAPVSEDHRLLWQSTPLNYLEKIFQVPFTLTPMTEGGFKNLVEELAKPNKEWIKGTPETIHADKVPQVGETGQVEKAKGASATQSGLDDKDDAKADQARKREAPSPPDPSPEPLRIEEWEREFMKRLYSLIPSPRSGKKFINLYRMVRATVDPAKWQEFVGSKDGGDHRAVLVMLAILIGYPSEGAVIFRRLLERRRNETWWEFIQSLEPRAGEMRETSGWAEFRTRLESLHELVADTEGCDVFREYAQRVARYSFQSGRVLLAAHLPDTED